MYSYNNICKHYNVDIWDFGENEKHVEWVPLGNFYFKCNAKCYSNIQCSSHFLHFIIIRLHFNNTFLFHCWIGLSWMYNKKYVQIMMMSWVRDELGLSANQRLQMDGWERYLFFECRVTVLQKRDNNVVCDVKWIYLHITIPNM